MRKRLVLVLTLTLIVCRSLTAWAAERVPVFVNGRDIQVEAQLIDGRTMVPLRAVCEILDATVSWDEASGAVHVTSLELERFLSKPKELRESLLALGDIIEIDPIIAAAIGETINKHGKPQQQPSSSAQAEYTRDHYIKKVRVAADAQRESIRAEAEWQRQQIKAKAEASKEHVRANAADKKAQVERYYRQQKQALDNERKERILQLENELARRGLGQSGYALEKKQELDAYYNSLYMQLEAQRQGNLKLVDDTEVDIDRSKAEDLRKIDVWEAENLQKVDNWEKQTLWWLQ